VPLGGVVNEPRRLGDGAVFSAGRRLKLQRRPVKPFFQGQYFEKIRFLRC
jgi:hypothetical protein